MTLPSPSTSARAVVTGASSGIGEALVRQLAARGHSLILVARRVDKLEVLAAELRASCDVQVDLHPCDLSDHAARAAFRDELADKEISILCNNAGFASYGKLWDLDPDREREQAELNAMAVQDLTLAVLPGMLQRQSGAILIVGSTSGHQPGPGNATYAASKAFANSLAESLHSELQGTDVTCTLLAPGPTLTGFTDAAGIPDIGGAGGSLVWVSAERVARDAICGMERNRRIVVPGLVAQLQTLGGRYTPRAVLLPILKQVFTRLN